MKANAPEKIWVHELSAMELDVPLKAFHVEYVRADAFIEKAVSYIQQHWIWNTKIIDDFKEYMKGE